jgi:predicted double-glycine peptidase
MMMMMLQVLVAVAAVVLGWRFARGFVAKGYSLSSSLRLRDSLVLLGIVLGVAGWLGLFSLLGVDPRLLWTLPEWVELVHQDLFETGFLFVVLFLSSAVVGVARLKKNRGAWGVQIFAVLAVCGYLGYSWKRQLPIAASLGHEVRGGVIVQTSGVSCVAAATANVLNWLGGDFAEKEMAELLHTTVNGTIAIRAAVVARELGYEACRFYAEEGEWATVQVPCVIFVDHPATGPESHCVSLMSVSQDCFEVWDPLVGRTFLSTEELAAIWPGRGITMWKANGNEY